MLRALQAVLAAFFGVQSERNRQRDFQQSSPLPYILVGLVLAGGSANYNSAALGIWTRAGLHELAG